MALRDLTLDEMIGVSGPIVEDAAALVRAVPEVAALATHVLRAHETALAASKKERAPEDAPKLSREAARVDFRHDHAVRATFYGLLAAESLELSRGQKNSDERAEHYVALRERLLPDGLAVTQGSHLAQAGGAKATLGALDADTRKSLDGVAIADGSVGEAVKLWGKHAGELGSIEQRKSLAQSADPTGVSAARAQWLTTMSTVLNTLVLADDASEAVRALRDPILVAANKSGSATPAESTPSDPTPPADPKPAEPKK